MNEDLINPILDKILKTGMDSLTESDRYILEFKKLPYYYKKKLNDIEELIDGDNISFFYKNVFLLNNGNYDSDMWSDT